MDGVYIFIFVPERHCYNCHVSRVILQAQMCQDARNNEFKMWLICQFGTTRDYNIYNTDETLVHFLQIKYSFMFCNSSKIRWQLFSSLTKASSHYLRNWKKLGAVLVRLISRNAISKLNCILVYIIPHTFFLLLLSPREYSICKSRKQYFTV